MRESFAHWDEDGDAQLTSVSFSKDKVPTFHKNKLTVPVVLVFLEQNRSRREEEKRREMMRREETRQKKWRSEEEEEKNEKRRYDERE